MPIYEYVCTNQSCGHELEALQKIADEPLVFCPSCGESSLKKKISAAAFRLKGTGWYETDFKNGGKKAAGKESAKESSGGSSSGDSSSASKSSSSGDAKPSGGNSGGGKGSTAAA